MIRKLKKTMLICLFLSLHISMHGFITDFFKRISGLVSNNKVATLALTACVGCAGYFAWNYLYSHNAPQTKIQSSMHEFGNFDTWYERCQILTPNIHHSERELSSYQTPLQWKEFQKTLDAFFATMKSDTAYLNNKKLWVEQENNATVSHFKTLMQQNIAHQALFVQKLQVAHKSVISFHGDLHGDIHSLLAYIKTLQEKGYMDKTDAFKIAKNNFYMIFLGDYVDRGRYGVEVLYTIMRLKIANPDKVFMVRGNHEDIRICSRDGFQSEFYGKFGNNHMAYERTCSMYNCLPVALYLGVGHDYIQCCHGGMEMGFDPTALLQHDSAIAFTWLGTQQELCNNAGEKFEEIFVPQFTDFTDAPRDLGKITIAQQDLAKAYTLNNEGGLYNGFMWNDFEVKTSKKYMWLGKRGLIYPRDSTVCLLQWQSRSFNKIRGVFRAHQHGDPDMMHSILDKDSGHTGLSKLWKNNNTMNKNLWDGIVCTFCVAPDSIYSNGGKTFDYDAFGLLTMAKDFEKWNLEVIRNPLSKIVPQSH